MARKNQSLIYEVRVAKELDRLGYQYQRHALFRANNGAKIIVDFLIKRLDLVVEVDGPEHSTTQGRMYDRWRDDYLKSLGYRTARITHRDLDTYTDALYHAIALARDVTSQDTFADREDYFRLVRVYNAFCEAISEFLLPNRLSNIQVTIAGWDRDGRAIDWTFGQNNAPDDPDS